MEPYYPSSTAYSATPKKLEMYIYTQAKWGSRLLDLRFAHSETQISEAQASGGVGSSPQLLHSETHGSNSSDEVGKRNPHRRVIFAAARPTDLIQSSSGYLLQAPSCPPPAAAASCSPPSRRVGEWTPHRSDCSTARPTAVK